MKNGKVKNFWRAIVGNPGLKILAVVLAVFTYVAVSI